MHNYPQAFSAENLAELLDVNSSCPSISTTECERLVDLARRRADARGEQSALDDGETDCIIATDWTSYAKDEFGYDNGNLNQFAIGVLNERASAGKGATLFTDTYVIQHGWLTTGDGRRSQTEAYLDDDYDGASEGEIWIPKGAQEYMAIIALSDELIHGSPDVTEAM